MSARNGQSDHLPRFETFFFIECILVREGNSFQARALSDERAGETSKCFIQYRLKDSCKSGRSWYLCRAAIVTLDYMQTLTRRAIHIVTVPTQTFDQCRSNHAGENPLHMMDQMRRLAQISSSGVGSRHAQDLRCCCKPARRRVQRRARSKLKSPNKLKANHNHNHNLTTSQPTHMQLTVRQLYPSEPSQNPANDIQNH